MRRSWAWARHAISTAGEGLLVGLTRLPWWVVALLALAGLVLAALLRLAKLVLPQDSADRTRVILEVLSRRRLRHRGVHRVR